MLSLLRYHELVSVHGRLDPLVNIDLQPATHVSVTITHKDGRREEVLNVYQTVAKFKQQLQQWFAIPPQNMKLYYCDKVRKYFIRGTEVQMFLPLFLRGTCQFQF